MINGPWLAVLTLGLAAIAAATVIAITWLSLRGVPASERPAVLEALRGVLAEAAKVLRPAMSALNRSSGADEMNEQA